VAQAGCRLERLKDGDGRQLLGERPAKRPLVRFRDLVDVASALAFGGQGLRDRL
jgi:hypothetical protein